MVYDFCLLICTAMGVFNQTFYFTSLHQRIFLKKSRYFEIYTKGELRKMDYLSKRTTDLILC